MGRRWASSRLNWRLAEVIGELSLLHITTLFALRSVSRPQQRPPTVTAEGENDSRARVVDGELNYGIQGARYPGANYVAELHIRPRPSSPPGRLPSEQQHPGETLLCRLAVVVVNPYPCRVGLDRLYLPCDIVAYRQRPGDGRRFYRDLPVHHVLHDPSCKQGPYPTRVIVGIFPRKILL